MELNKTKKGFYIFTSFIVLMLLLMGSWWIYLVIKLSTEISLLNNDAIDESLVFMIKWEGISFMFFLLTLVGALFYIHFQDHKKTKSLQAFFSSLTHELKTPLSSIKLQTQVLSEYLNSLELTEEQKLKSSKYTDRLIFGSNRLEDQLDNHLQLARITRNADVNLREIELISFIETEFARSPIEVNLQTSLTSAHIKGDDFALSTILRNLLENTMTHQKEAKLITIKIDSNENHILLNYNDSEQMFSGNIDKLGELFYKHESPKGSGIGLYLIKRLMLKMNGKFKVINTSKLSFSFQFQKAKGHHA